ncbi:AMP-binding protein [Salipiger mucosus]|uniref:3-methylmercaptopropionyl-CoA ligase n=1 Tax=Salipiger mucosus DSM 16094 TaxID=1123237 RepID=S9R0N7_9RHOB|nr:AMP-binding protein [Salipiger mucosus]EPX85447.1 Long-chain-fatty-acid--CoA ligase [Salipiger mucosus DSM 16094]
MQENFSALDRAAANYVPLSPVSFLERAAEVHADVVAVVHGDTRRSWANTADRVARVAQGLADRGIAKGDTVSALAPNMPELFELHFAVPVSGGVLSTINTRLEAETIAHILDHSDSRVVLVSEDLRPLLEEALALAENAPRVLQIGGAADDYAALLQADPWQGSWLPDDEWDAITLNYTSGTSGRPKGVVYHHRGAYLMALGTVAAWQVAHHPVYMSVVPMFHCNAWGHLWKAPIVGGTLVFPASNSPEDLFETIRREKVTHFGAAPVVLQMMAESDAAPDEPLEPRLQVTTAGAPPPPSVLEKTDAMGMDVMHVYGLTETYGHILQCLPQPVWDHLEPEETAERRARQGVRFPMVEAVDVVDRETGQKVPKDGETQGEISIRGNTVMKGYYKDQAATDEAFEGGMFRSGDAAVVQPDGYVQIRDRLKDVIISGGENISSVEVEAVLYRHPAVAAAAVVARSDPKWGEVPCAVVELRDGEEAGEDEIIAFCRERLAGFKTPKSVLFREIPKTAVGKIQKFQLRNMVRSLDA